jgi:hypothetical protein
MRRGASVPAGSDVAMRSRSLHAGRTSRHRMRALYLRGRIGSGIATWIAGIGVATESSASKDAEGAGGCRELRREAELRARPGRVMHVARFLLVERLRPLAHRLPQLFVQATCAMR